MKCVKYGITGKKPICTSCVLELTRDFLDNYLALPKMKESPEKQEPKKAQTQLSPGYYWWKMPGNTWWNGILQIHGEEPFCTWTLYVRGTNYCHGEARNDERSAGSLHYKGISIEIGPRILEPSMGASEA